MQATLLNESDLDPDSSPFTVLHSDQKLSILEHLNEEHFEDLMRFVTAFTPLGKLSTKQLDIKLTDIYAEGFSLLVAKTANDSHLEPKQITQNKTQNAVYFIAFPQPLSSFEELQYQFILLKQQADKKLRKKTIKLTEQLFTVEDQYFVTDNMYRLVLTLKQRNDSRELSFLPYDEPGYAYLFDFDFNYPFNDSNEEAELKTSTTTKAVTKAIETEAKHLHRYYTLRKACYDPEKAADTAWIDVFLHGKTLGSQWLDCLDLGKTVKTKREVPEKVTHLTEGQALLIADETSIPTVARLLELWQNPIAPLVVYITHDEVDQDYLQHRQTNTLIDDKIEILTLKIGALQQGEPLAQLIDTTLQQHLQQTDLNIEKVWGAIEVSTSKALRPLLKSRLGLDRSDMIVKGYWRQQ